MSTAEFQIIMERLDRLEQLITRGTEVELPVEPVVSVPTSFRQRVDEALRRAAQSDARRAGRKGR